MVSRGQSFLDEFLHLVGNRQSEFSGENLLAVLLESVRKPAFRQSTSRITKPVAELTEFLEAISDFESARLCRFVPFCSGEGPIGSAERLIWLPRGLPDKRRVGFSSSRLGRSPDENPHWFDTVRTVCARIDNETECVVCTNSTAGFDFFHRAAWLFGVDCVEVTVADKKLNMAEWILQLPDFASSAAINDRYPMFVSPGISCEKNDSSVIVDDRDTIHALLCDVIYALQVSAKGNTLRAISTRLTQRKSTVFLSSDANAMSAATREDLIESGAVQHHLLQTTSIEKPPFKMPDSVSAVETQSSQFLSLAEIETRTDGWLTHCTRRRTGPWPDEDETTYIDDLLFRRVGANHSALAALCRIIRTTRLVATSDLIRGKTPVVSFSERPLQELLNARIFRSHLSRWDFEPYGICIDKSLMQRRGAQPVIYSDGESYQSLAEENRPFFQKAATDDGEVDWAEEQEWRIVNDFSLAELPNNGAIVFVPSAKEAQFIRPFTRFDICVAGEPVN